MKKACGSFLPTQKIHLEKKQNKEKLGEEISVLILKINVKKFGKMFIGNPPNYFIFNIRDYRSKSWTQH